MKLTTGAVECLSRGAAHDDPDVNAVGPNGDLFEAGQMVTEGDAELRRSAIRTLASAPLPIASPREKLRLEVEVQVSTRSPMPHRPANVSLRAPSALPKRSISAMPRAISAARAFWPRRIIGPAFGFENH